MRIGTMTPRIVALGITAVLVSAALTQPATAQRVGSGHTTAQQVQELVLNQRAQVLAHLESILARERRASVASESEPAAAENAAEPEEADAGGEDEPSAEDASVEEDADVGGEEESGEEESGEEEDIVALPETGTGPAPVSPGPLPAMLAALTAVAAIAPGVRRRGA